MREYIVKGIIGTATPAAGVVISLLQQIEAWLRVFSLLTGITVGVVTIWSIVRKRNGGKKDSNEQDS